MQNFKFIEICHICNLDQSPREQNYLFFTKPDETVILNVQEKAFCKSCRREIHRELNFSSGKPVWLICETDLQFDLVIDSLPKLLQLNEANYKLLCATYNNGMSHFLSIFFLNNSYYMVDDQNQAWSIND